MSDDDKGYRKKKHKYGNDEQVEEIHGGYVNRGILRYMSSDISHSRMVALYGCRYGCRVVRRHTNILAVG